MEYIVMAHDGTDEDALNRRLQHRPAHMAQGDKMLEAGKYRYGAALLDGNKIVGSMIVVDFDSKDELDEWLKIEPYVVNNVWANVEVIPCRVGPRFGGKL